MAVSPDIRKRLLYAKYLLSRAKRDQNDRNELALAACLLLMHDATELLMLAATDHLAVGSKWGFMEFWDKVKQSGHKEPGNKLAMSQLNDMRVSLKHKGILPRSQSVRDLFPRVEIFCEEVTKDLLDLDFGDLSLVDLVATDDVRNKLKEAEQAFTSGDRDTAFANLRRAFDTLYDLMADDAVLIKAPQDRAIRGPLPDEARKWLMELQGTVSDLVVGLNIVMLGIDPAKYRLLMISTPSISHSLSGKTQVILNPFQSEIPDRIFHLCLEFVVDVALNASR